MDVSIIIVNYNTCKLTLQCLESIFKWTLDVEFEIILVDNHSEDDSVKMTRTYYPTVKIIENKENMGFGCANNIGAKEATGKYLFLLNSDTILIENVIKIMYDFMEKHPEYSSCGCNLINAKGDNVPTHGCLPSLWYELFGSLINKYSNKYYKNHLSLAQTIHDGDLMNPGYIVGADIFIRSNVFKNLEGFDSNIFMYFEETDLYFRMKRSGYKSILLPEYNIIHLVGGSMSPNHDKDLQRFKMFERSRMYYYRKNYNSVVAKMVKVCRMLSVLRHNYSFKFEKIKILREV